MPTFPFRPRARLINALGFELISSETTAVVELVKNSYDADASRVVVAFNGPLSQGAGSITVADDGTGMSAATLRTAFLEPATPSKATRRVTAKGRRVLGEKGIGRFAAGRLADRMRVITARRGKSTESTLNVDWTQFEKSAYLDEVEVRTGTRKRDLIVKDGLLPSSADGSRDWPSGTVLQLDSLRRDWDAEMLADLKSTLGRLLKPGFREDFAVSMVVSGAGEELEELSGAITPPPFLEDPDYRLFGTVRPGGKFNLTYVSRMQGSTKIESPILAKPDAAVRSGSFKIDLRVWDRDVAPIGELATRYGMKRNQIRQELTRVAGVSIFRDGFRVLPYGEPNNDWLRLDLRRVQNPTLRLSQNQVLGIVEISSEANPHLRDQTNREGLIESLALADLRESIRWVLSELEVKRYEERPRRGKPVGEIFGEFQLGALREFAAQAHPGDRRLNEAIGEEEKRLGEAGEHIRRVLVRYRRWAALGRIVEIILHDASNSLAAIGSAAKEATRLAAKISNGVLGDMTKQLETIKRRRDALASLFEKIRPFSGRGRSKIEGFELADAISDVLELYAKELERSGVSVEVSGNAALIGSRADIEQVIFNLLDNSLYWLGRVRSKQKEISIELGVARGFREILFSDTGPGIPEEIQERIFEPWFTTKPDGAGMGLDIVGEIAEDYRGDLSLVEGETNSGATFRVRLKDQVAS